MIVKQVESVPRGQVQMEGCSGAEKRLLIGPDDGAANFYMRQFILAPGGHTPLHRHDWEHEVYICAGAGVLCGDGKDRETPLAAGDCVFVPGGQMHQFRSTGDGELKFLCLVPNTSPP